MPQESEITDHEETGIAKSQTCCYKCELRTKTITRLSVIIYILFTLCICLIFVSLYQLFLEREHQRETCSGLTFIDRY